MAHSATYVKIMNSARWRQTRNAYLSEHPLCERCQESGYITAAQCVHHIIPVESGKTDRECEELAFGRNLMALCFGCHSEIHREARSHSKTAHKTREAERLERWKARREGAAPRGGCFFREGAGEPKSTEPSSKKLIEFQEFGLKMSKLPQNPENIPGNQPELPLSKSFSER